MRGCVGAVVFVSVSERFVSSNVLCVCVVAYVTVCNGRKCAHVCVPCRACSFIALLSVHPPQEQSYRVTRRDIPVRDRQEEPLTNSHRYTHTHACAHTYIHALTHGTHSPGTSGSVNRTTWHSRARTLTLCRFALEQHRYGWRQVASRGSQAQLHTCSLGTGWE